MSTSWRRRPCSCRTLALPLHSPRQFLFDSQISVHSHCSSPTEWLAPLSSHVLLWITHLPCQNDSHFLPQQNLQAFYPPGSLDAVAARIVQSGALQTLSANWKLPVELASDLVKIALFDVVLLVDDSGSMAFEQGGERIEDLKMYVCLRVVLPIRIPR